MSHDDDALPKAGAALVAGCTAVVATAFLAAALVPAHAPIGRAAALAITAGAAAAVIADWRVAAGVTVFAALVFVGFLDHRYGVLTGNGSAWRYAAVVAGAAVAGRCRPWWRAVRAAVSTRARPGSGALVESYGGRR